MNNFKNTYWSKIVDNKFNPADNFFLHVNNKWIKENKIPDDMSRWGMFNILDESNKVKIKTILESDKLNKNIKILHKGFLKKTGKEVLCKLLNKVNNIKTVSEYKTVATELSMNQLISSTLEFYVYANLNESDKNILYISGGGLHLPERDYYLDEDKKKKLDEYHLFMKKYIEQVINDNIISDIEINTDEIINFEKKIASWLYSKVKRRNPKYYNNPITYVEFQKKFPNIRINSYLKHKNKKVLGDFNMNMSNPVFIEEYNNFLNNSDNLKILKQHLLWSLMLKLPLCSKKYEQIKFNFFAKNFSGLKEMKPLWKRGVDYINSQLGELLGLEFCKKYFTETSKNKCLEMVKYIIDELKNRLENNDWMDVTTKEKAVDKLLKIKVKIGYPNKKGRIDVSTLNLDSNKSFFENHCAMNNFDTLYNLNELGTVKNKERFHMYPHMVNAYYSPVNNEIVFPAGILQPPFFDSMKDMSANFGAIGAIIGHEITHGFDDQGRKYDGTGNLNDWWSKQVLVKYQAKTDKIKELFNSFTINGENVNGELTLGENIADLGGLSISYHAYMNYLKDNPNKNTIVDGYTSKQRFFLSFARIWCSHMRNEESTVRLSTDPHSPPIHRVNGTLMNFVEFYKVFNVTADNKLYLKKNKRGSVW